MMLVLVTVGGLLMLLVGFALLFYSGLRKGDQPDDARLLATEMAGAAPLHARVVLENPGRSAVLIAVSSRPQRLPDWLLPALSVSVPYKRGRAKFRPEESSVVGVLESSARGEWEVPLEPSARRWRVRVTVGQTQGRLRVIRAPVRLGGSGSQGPASRRPSGAPRRPAQTG